MPMRQPDCASLAFSFSIKKIANECRDGFVWKGVETRMDLPVFHLDFLGNRFLIAMIAVLHVIINHAMAVGAIPLIALMEWWGKKTGERRWDDLAYQILTVCFVITTTFGALTGVGIWFSTSLVNPYAIGSMIRVFFWAWFAEWIIFVSEVVLILLYYLLWKRWQGEWKRYHIALGGVLALTSWLTMAIIVAILGYMMDVGNWTHEKSIATAILNPIYLPQLAFRTPLAMMTAGFFSLFLTYFFTRKEDPFQSAAARWISLWSLGWAPLCLAGGIWYWKAVPDSMVGNLAVALGTQAFEGRYNVILDILLVSFLLALVTLLWSAVKPSRMPRFVLIIPFAVAIVSLGYFERVREFIRKPYVISGYMYANGIRVDDYPLLNQNGVLPYALYADAKEVTEENHLQAGKEVFLIACTRCHTTNGVNGILARLETMYGSDRWDRDTVLMYLKGMHNVRPYMPPFPGNNAELGALVDYLFSLRAYPAPIKGAQTADGSSIRAEKTYDDNTRG
ncbi:MAG: cytochrome c [Candidatus Omnitrophota bacterium]|jgi:mono/diheme cytochrome c family protein|nr:MAG: cytochrome c [Candidatus Omnitrophota bacterium]